LTDAQQGHLQREIVRDRINRLRTQIQHILKAITLFAKEAPSLCRRMFVVIVPVLYPLLRSRLVGDTALQCTHAVTRAIGYPLSGLAYDIADSLRIAATVIDRPLGKRETMNDLYQLGVSLSKPLVRCIKTISTSALRHPISVPTIHL